MRAITVSLLLAFCASGFCATTPGIARVYDGVGRDSSLYKVLELQHEFLEQEESSDYPDYFGYDNVFLIAYKFCKNSGLCRIGRTPHCKATPLDPRKFGYLPNCHPMTPVLVQPILEKIEPLTYYGAIDEEQIRMQRISGVRKPSRFEVNVTDQVKIINEDVFEFEGHKYFIGSTYPAESSENRVPGFLDCRTYYHFGKLHWCKDGFFKVDNCVLSKKVPKNCIRTFDGYLANYDGLRFDELPYSVKSKLKRVDVKDEVEVVNSVIYFKDIPYEWGTCDAMADADPNTYFHRVVGRSENGTTAYIHNIARSFESLESCRIANQIFVNSFNDLEYRKVLCKYDEMLVNGFCTKVETFPPYCFRSYHGCSGEEPLPIPQYRVPITPEMQKNLDMLKAKHEAEDAESEDTEEVYVEEEGVEEALLTL